MTNEVLCDERGVSGARNDRFCITKRYSMWNVVVVGVVVVKYLPTLFPRQAPLLHRNSIYFNTKGPLRKLNRALNAILYA